MFGATNQQMEPSDMRAILTLIVAAAFLMTALPGCKGTSKPADKEKSSEGKAKSDEKPAAEAPRADEKPAEEKAEEKPAEEKPAEEKPAEEKAEEKPAEEKPAEEKPAEEKADGGLLDLPKLGLKGKAPAGSKAGDNIVGEGHMVQGPGLVATVSPAGDSTPKDAAAAKEDADMYSPLNWKEEKLEDGYVVSFENKGGMGTNYWVTARREIGGKAYKCSTTASQPQQQKNALEFCKSLTAK